MKLNFSESEFLGYGDERTEFLLKYWLEGGLDSETRIRLSKALRLCENYMVERIGMIDKRDRLRLELRVESNPQ